MNSLLVRHEPGGPVVQFEQNEFVSMAVTCTWPRRSYHLEVHDPDNECGWTHSEWDQDAMVEHAKEHLTCLNPSTPS